MSKRKYQTIALILAFLVCFSLVIIGLLPQQNTEVTEKTSPKFVISSWSFPDAYGQGIEGFEFFENSTGSWHQVGGEYAYGDSYSINWNASVAIKLRCWTWFNSTLTGAATTTAGKNYQQHSVSVVETIHDTVVFSQQNFTFFYVDSSIDPPRWFYGYEVVLNFLPEWSTTYIITVNYQIYYEGSSWAASSQSITSFSETLPNDAMSTASNTTGWCQDGSDTTNIYPYDITALLAVSGNATSVTGGTYASTHVVDNVSYYTAWTVTGDSHTDIFQLNYTAASFNKIDIHYYFERYSGTGTFDEGGIQLYNQTSGAWEYVYSDADWQAAMTNRSISTVPDDYLVPDGNVWLRVLLTMTDSGAGTDWGLFIDYCALLTFNDTISSDGSLLTFTSDSNGASYDITFDATNSTLTASTVPFLVVSCTEISTYGGWNLQQYDGSAWATLQSTNVTTAGIHRYNMRALDTYVHRLRLNLTQTATITFDFFKIYGISNWTVSIQGALYQNDFLYVDDGALYASGTHLTAANYLWGDYVPALSVATATYKYLNNTRSGTISGIKTYVGSWDSSWNTADSFALRSGTLTDIRFQMIGVGSVNAIEFISYVAWQDVSEAQVHFVTPFDPEIMWSLNAWYMLFGMGLVIGSAMFLAVKVKNRDDMSNAFYFSVVAFMIGWALIIGGVLP